MPLQRFCNSRGLATILSRSVVNCRFPVIVATTLPGRSRSRNRSKVVREVARVFALTNTALATSGNYRNFYVEDGQRYSHTIDPVSGRPIRHKLASVTVLDPSCARADALATALMVLGEEKGRQFCEKNQIAAYFLIHDKTALTVYASPAFQSFVGEAQL